MRSLLKASDPPLLFRGTSSSSLPTIAALLRFVTFFLFIGLPLLRLALPFLSESNSLCKRAAISSSVSSLTFTMESPSRSRLTTFLRSGSGWDDCG